MANGWGHEWDSLQTKEEQKAYAQAWLTKKRETGDSLQADAAGHDALTALRSNMAAQTPQMTQPEKQVMFPQYQRPKLPFTGQEIQSWFGEKETPSQLTEQDKIDSAFKPSQLTGLDYVNSLNSDDKKIFSGAYFKALSENSGADAAEAAGKLAVESMNMGKKNLADRKAILENNDFRSDVENAITINAFNNMSTEDQDAIINAWQSAPTQPNLQTGEPVKAGIDAIFGALSGINAQQKYGISEGGWNTNPQPTQPEQPKRRLYVKTQPAPAETESDESKITQYGKINYDSKEYQALVQREQEINRKLELIRYGKLPSEERSALLEERDALEQQLENWGTEEQKAWQEEAEKHQWYSELMPQINASLERVNELQKQKDMGFYDVQQELDEAKAEHTRLVNEYLTQAQSINETKGKAIVSGVANTAENMLYQLRSGFFGDLRNKVDSLAAFSDQDYDYHKDPFALQELSMLKADWDSKGLSEEEKAQLENDYWNEVDKTVSDHVANLKSFSGRLKGIVDDNNLKSEEKIQRVKELALEYAQSTWEEGAYEQYNDVNSLYNIVGVIEKGLGGIANQGGYQIDTLLLSFFSGGDKAGEVAKGIKGVGQRIKNLLTDAGFYSSFLKEWTGDRAEAYRAGQELTNTDKWLLVGRAALKGAIEVGFGKGEGGGVEAYWAGRTADMIGSAFSEMGEEVSQYFVDWAGINLGHVMQGRYDQLLPVYSPNAEDGALFNLETATELLVGTFFQTLGLDVMRMPLNTIAKAMSGRRLNSQEMAEMEEAGRLFNEAINAQAEHDQFEAAVNHNEQPTVTAVTPEQAKAEQPAEQPAEQLDENDRLPELEEKAEQPAEQKAEESGYPTIEELEEKTKKYAQADAEMQEGKDYPDMSSLMQKTQEYAKENLPWEQIKAEINNDADLEGPGFNKLSEEQQMEFLRRKALQLMSETPEGRLQTALSQMDDNQLMDVANGSGDYANTPENEKRAARQMLNERRRRFVMENAKLDDVESEILARARERNGDTQAGTNAERETGTPYLDMLDDAELEQLRKELSETQPETEEEIPDVTVNDLNTAIANIYTGDEQLTDPKLRGVSLDKLQRWLEKKRTQTTQAEQPAQAEPAPVSPNATGDGVSAEEAGKDTTTKEEAPAEEATKQTEPEELSELNVFKGVDNAVLENVLKIFPEGSTPYEMAKAEQDKRNGTPERLADTLAVKEVGDDVQRQNVVEDTDEEPRGEANEIRPENTAIRAEETGTQQAGEEQTEQGTENGQRQQEQTPEPAKNPVEPVVQTQAEEKPLPEREDAETNRQAEDRQNAEIEQEEAAPADTDEGYKANKNQENPDAITEGESVEPPTPPVPNRVYETPADEMKRGEREQGQNLEREKAVDLQKEEAAQNAEKTDAETVTGEIETPKTEVEKNTQKQAKDWGMKYGRTNGDGRSDSGVHLVNTGRLSTSRMHELSLIDRVAKKFGFSVEVYDGLNKDANGMYERGTRKIYLNANTENAFETVVGHEMYHMVQSLSPDSAKKIADLFNKWADRTGFDLDYAIESKIEEYTEQGVMLGKTDDERKAAAKEELIANTMYRFLSDENTMRQVYAASPNLFTRVMDYVRKLQQTIKEMLHDYEAETPEARMLAKQEGAIDSLYNAMRSALEDMNALGETKKAAAKVKGNGEATRSYEQKVREATSKKEITQAAREMGAEILRKTGNQASEDNLIRLMNAAQDVNDLGTLPGQAMRDYGLKYSANDPEVNRALQNLGAYAAQLKADKDVQEYLELVNGQQDDGMAYQLKYDSKNRPYVEIDLTSKDQKAFDGLTEKQARDKALQILRAKFLNKPLYIDTNHTILTRNEAVHFTHRAEPGTAGVKMAKIRSMSELDNVLSAAEFYKSEHITHGHQDWLYVDKYLVRIKMANVDAIYQITIGNRYDGERRLHDIRLHEDKSTYVAKAVAVQDNPSNADDAYINASDVILPDVASDVKQNNPETALEKDLEQSDGTETHYGDNMSFSLRVKDKKELDFLNNQKTEKTYKTMQLVDGKLYPPMAAVVAGNMEDYSELGTWEKATEHPELIKDGNKFTLNKGRGKGSLAAAYNPYMHSSNLMINDQFSGAWNRPELVTVECEVPVSENTSGYHAQYAKDSVGWHSWHTGTVAGQLRNKKGIERQVFLSRWIKPVRIVPNSEVAAHYADLLKGTDIEIPDNVVYPELLNELKKLGVPIKETGKVKTDNMRYSLSRQRNIFENNKAAEIDEDLPKTRQDISREIISLGNERNELRAEIKHFENETLTEDMLNRMTGKDKTEQDKALAEYKAAEDEAKIGEKQARLKEIEKRISQLNKQSYALRIRELQQNIENSGLSQDEYFRKAAIKEFGYTPYYYDAGYILPNGKMLNFSGEKGKHYGMRGQDHRAISTVFEGAFDTGTDALNAFVNMGNVRIMDESPGVDISLNAKLTPEQIATIRKHIRERIGERGYYVDFTDDDGRTAVSLEYYKNDRIDKILNDIAYVQNNGEAPNRSDIADFHMQYSLSETDARHQWDQQMESTGGQTELVQKLTGDLWNAIVERKRNQKAEQYGSWKQHVSEMAQRLLEDTNSQTMNAKQIEDRLTQILEEYEAQKTTNAEGAANAVNQALNDLRGLVQEALADQVMDEHYREVRSALAKGIYINKDIQKEIGSAAELRDFRNALSGFCRVFTNEKAANAAGALHLDGAGWDELQSIDPDLFNPETHWLERAQALRDFVEMHKDDVATYDPVTADFIRGKALEMLAEYYTGSTETDAGKRTKDALDKANKKVQQLNRQLDADMKKQLDLEQQLKDARQEARTAKDEAWKQEIQATRPLKDMITKLQDELKTAREETLATGKELTQARKDADKLENQLNEKENRNAYLRGQMKLMREQNKKNQAAAVRNYKTHAKEQAERRAQNVKARKKIKAIAKELKQMVSKPTKNAYVPMDKLQALNELLEAFQKNDKRKLDKTTEAWMKRVRELRESKNSLTASTFDPGFEKQMQEACDILREKGTNQLDSAELEYVSNVFTEALHQIKNATRMIDRKKNADAFREGANAIDVNNKQKGVSNNRFLRGAQKFTMEHLSPKRFFDMLAGYADNAWSRIRDDLIEGQRRQERARQLMTDEVRSLTEGENAKKFDKFMGKGAELIDTGYKDRNGNKIMITQAQRVSMYLHSLNADNLRHFIYGVTLPNQQLLKQGKKDQAYERSQTLRLINPGDYKNVEESVAAVRAALSKLTDGMTEYEKAWAKAYQGIMERSTNYINETSMKLNGYEKATVENYFPIKTDRNFLQVDFESLVRDGTIEGMGMLKERIHGTNPMTIEDVNDVIGRMINNTSLYYGMAIPVRNFNKMYNATMGEYEDSVKASLKRTWGTEGEQYLDRLMQDIQGTGRREERTFLDDFRGKYAGAVLTLNPSVMMKQAASLPTAAASLGWQPIMKALGNVKKVDPNLINKYTSAYIERASGGIRDMEANAQRNTAVKRGLHRFGNGIQAVDLATVRKIWTAAEYYVQEQQPNLKQGSDEYYQAVARAYETALEDTQPEYGVMQRPHILRTQNQLLRSVLMFKTQSMQNFNILYDATMNLRAKQAAYKANQSAENKAQLDQAKTNMARAASSQIVSAAVLAVMTALGKALLHKPEPYQDEKGEVTAESVSYQLSKDAISSMAGMMVGGSEIFDLIVGISEGKAPFDIEANSLSLLNDIYQSVYKLGNAAGAIGDSSLRPDQKREKILKALKEFGLNVGAAYGIPGQNIWKIGESAYKYVDDLINGRGLEGLTTGDVTLNTAARYMGDALKKGDTETYTRLYNRLLKQGKSASQINSAMKTWMKTNDPRIQQAASAIEGGDIDTYNRLINEMTRDGYGMANVVTAIEAVRKQEPEAETAAAEYQPMTYEQIIAAQDNDAADEYTYAQLNQLLENGNTQAARKLQSALFKSKGTTSVKSALTRYWKPKYQEAYQSRNRTELNRIVKLLKTMGYSDSSLSKWKTIETEQATSTKKSGFGSGGFGSGRFGSTKKSSKKKSSSRFGGGFGGSWR